MSGVLPSLSRAFDFHPPLDKVAPPLCRAAMVVARSLLQKGGADDVPDVGVGSGGQ